MKNGILAVPLSIKAGAPPAMIKMCATPQTMTPQKIML